MSFFLPLSSSLVNLASNWASAISSVLARGSTTARRLCRILRTSALAAANDRLALRSPRRLLADRSRDRPRLDALLDGLLCLSGSRARPRRLRSGTAKLSDRPCRSTERPDVELCLLSRPLCCLCCPTSTLDLVEGTAMTCKNTATIKHMEHVPTAQCKRTMHAHHEQRRAHFLGSKMHTVSGAGVAL